MKTITLTVNEADEVKVLYALSRINGIATVAERHPLAAYEAVNPLRIEGAADAIDRFFAHPALRNDFKQKKPAQDAPIVYNGRRGTHTGYYGHDFCVPDNISQWLLIATDKK